MERQQAPPPTTGMVISNLTAVYSGGKMYLGVVKETAKAGRTVLVHDCVEVIVRYRQMQGGQMAAETIPVPVFPLQVPTDLYIRADIAIDCSKDRELGEFYSGVTGVVGIATTVPSSILIGV